MVCLVHHWIVVVPVRCDFYCRLDTLAPKFQATHRTGRWKFYGARAPWTEIEVDMQPMRNPLPFLCRFPSTQHTGTLPELRPSRYGF